LLQEYFELIKKRCNAAETLVITGARVEIVKGTYTPITGAIHCDWPVYQGGGMVLIYHSQEPADYCLENNSQGEWLIFHRADMFPENLEETLQVNSRQESYSRIFDPDMSYVRMPCYPGTYPELRVEGHNGIQEYEVVNGVFYELDDEVFVLEVLPVAFIEVLKATEKLTVDLLNGVASLVAFIEALKATDKLKADLLKGDVSL
jgi:hypothetical protein